MVQHSTDKFCAKFLSYKIGLSVKVSLEWVPFFVLETKLSHHIFRCIFTYQNVKPMFLGTGLSLAHLCVLKLVKLALPLLTGIFICSYCFIWCYVYWTLFLPIRTNTLISRPIRRRVLYYFTTRVSGGLLFPRFATVSRICFESIASFRNSLLDNHRNISH